MNKETRFGKTEVGGDDGHQELFPCEVCGRCFAADVLTRHGPICRKVFNKKRIPFNSLKQRLQGTDIPTVKKAPQSKSQPVKKSNWRQQHEDFINAIQSAKQCMLAMKEGRPLPPPPAPTINPDYIQCPYCMRRFNETAAKRHINFCKDQSSRRVFDPAQTAARLAARAQGKAQANPKKEPTVTSAVGALLQSRAKEDMKQVSARPGLAMDPALGTKLRQGFSKSSKEGQKGEWHFLLLSDWFPKAEHPSAPSPGCPTSTKTHRSVFMR
ncbi:zinc finger C2HC domain-containing protein 1B [Perognathus longimembris pacificus]|uniref:zinc finger C2HC domain-containing protein 1B n=1 Tax=Perognathus longimembris pacificus TaxID=214514 RepID=UPI002019DEAB|nr:zinc finger C2HC domain-containing protein 1B [Perognathus longimembris pacificus]